jgi:hypothetical protein
LTKATGKKGKDLGADFCDSVLYDFGLLPFADAHTFSKNMINSASAKLTHHLQSRLP